MLAQALTAILIFYSCHTNQKIILMSGTKHVLENICETQIGCTKMKDNVCLVYVPDEMYYTLIEMEF